MYVFVSDTSLINLALRQPAWQSSTYAPLYPASLAVDGNKDTDVSHYSCSVTNFTIEQWWAVDIGTMLHVLGVNVTNRGDQRLGEFRAIVMNTML